MFITRNENLKDICDIYFFLNHLQLFFHIRFNIFFSNFTLLGFSKTFKLVSIETLLFIFTQTYPPFILYLIKLCNYNNK